MNKQDETPNIIETTVERVAGMGAPTVIFLKGIPASGKSTWAKAYISKNPDTVRINKDDLRAMAGTQWSKEFENIVYNTSQRMGERALFMGFNVVVDDTNFNPSHYDAWKAIAERYGAGFQVVEFKTTLAECLARNAEREGRHRIPESVIKGMYNKNFKDE